MQADRQLDDAQIRAEMPAWRTTLVIRNGDFRPTGIRQLLAFQATQLPRCAAARQQVA